MKIITAFIVLTTLAGGFVACQRDVEAPNPNIINIDSSYIELYMQLDTSFATGMDTVFKSRFFYDGQKRLVRIEQAGYDPGATTIPYTNTESRSYNGSDTVPFRVSRAERYTNGQRFDDTSFFTYDAGKMVSKDSNVLYSSGTLFTRNVITYTPGGTGFYIVKRKEYNAAGTITDADSIRSSRTFSGGNVISSSDSIFKTPAGLFDVYNYTYTYDNKRNPFKRVAISYPHFIVNMNRSEYQFVPNPTSANNPLSFTLLRWFGGATSNFSGQLLYSYNSAGNPGIIRVGNPSGLKLKDLIFYRSL